MDRKSKTHPLAIILTSKIIRHIVLFDISLKTGHTIDLYLSADKASKLSADMAPKSNYIAGTLGPRPMLGWHLDKPLHVMPFVLDFRSFVTLYI